MCWITQDGNLPHFTSKNPRYSTTSGEKFKLIGYCDDVKPAICKKKEIEIIDRAVTLFEKASGCQLHCDPASKKCKILLLGSWKKWSKKDVPLKYLTISEHLDILGVKLFANFNQTRTKNGEILIKKINDLINIWKSGKFMPLLDRPTSINTYALS